MYIDNDSFDAWMERIWEKLDALEHRIGRKAPHRPAVDGELLLDNQDLCLMMNCSKRTLQRFRSSGFLPYRRINQKLYCLESDVQRFIRDHLRQVGGNRNHL
jgi:hypothetical protein